MANGSRLIDYLPFYDSETDEFKEIMETEQYEINILWAIKEATLRESFVMSALNNGLERMELMLGLNGSGQSVEERRSRILFTLMGDTPYTMISLAKRLKVLYGDGIAVRYGRSDYSLDVVLNIKYADRVEELKGLLYKIVPANIGISIKVLYNTHESLRKLWHYELKRYTHNMIREKESI